MKTGYSPALYRADRIKEEGMLRSFHVHVIESIPFIAYTPFISWMIHQI